MSVQGLGRPPQMQTSLPMDADIPPHGSRLSSPWMLTSLPMDADPPPLYKQTPMETEPPDAVPPDADHLHLDADPPRCRLPPPLDRMTDRCFWKLPSLAVGKNITNRYLLPSQNFGTTREKQPLRWLSRSTNQFNGIKCSGICSASLRDKIGCAVGGFQKCQALSYVKKLHMRPYGHKKRRGVWNKTFLLD